MTLTLLQSPAQAADWLRSRVDGDLQGDSRRVRKGDGFLAWPGRRHDARDDLDAVFDQGAAACVVEHQGLTARTHAGADPHKLAAYDQLKSASGWIADAFYGHPSRHLPVIAVTGTNGKTSITWWLSQALTSLQRPCMAVGTLGLGQVQLAPQANQLSLRAEAGHEGLTTPDAIGLHRQLRRWLDQGAQACAMEASSIGLVEQRLAGLKLHTAVFTNLTPDHLDYHGSLEAYGQAKASLFDAPGVQVAVISVDDAFGQGLADRINAQRPDMDLWTVSAQPLQGHRAPARVQLRSLEVSGRDGLQHLVFESGGREHRLVTPLMGRFNVENLLLVWAVLMAWGQAPEPTLQALQSLRPVPGRMLRLGGAGRPHVVVDYAHTPDAVSKVLAEVNRLASLTSGRVITVLGCGGDRDAIKRPLMAQEAQRLSHQFWLTSDNPRSEDPEAIARDMLAGLTHQNGLTIELQRDRAIAQAIAQASDRDWVVIAGKGHEAHQEIQGVRHPFSDDAHAQAALNQWRAA